MPGTKEPDHDERGRKILEDAGFIGGDTDGTRETQPTGSPNPEAQEFEIITVGQMWEFSRDDVIAFLIGEQEMQGRKDLIISASSFRGQDVDLVGIKACGSEELFILFFEEKDWPSYLSIELWSAAIFSGLPSDSGEKSKEVRFEHWVYQTRIKKKEILGVFLEVMVQEGNPDRRCVTIQLGGYGGMCVLRVWDNGRIQFWQEQEDEDMYEDGESE